MNTNRHSWDDAPRPLGRIRALLVALTVTAAVAIAGPLADPAVAATAHLVNGAPTVASPLHASDPGSVGV